MEDRRLRPVAIPYPRVSIFEFSARTFLQVDLAGVSAARIGHKKSPESSDTGRLLQGRISRVSAAQRAHGTAIRRLIGETRAAFPFAN